MTEVVKDIDIMPTDPYDNLPLNIPLVPVLLNGRSRPMAGLARRRVLVSGCHQALHSGHLAGQKLSSEGSDMIVCDCDALS